MSTPAECGRRLALAVSITDAQALEAARILLSTGDQVAA